MTARIPARIMILFAALAVNLALFAFAPLFMLKETTGPPPKRSAQSIYLNRYRPPAPEQEKEYRKTPPKEKASEPPKRPQVLKKSPARRPMVDLDLPRLSFKLNPRLTGGISITPPPPPPPTLPSEFESGQVDQPPRIVSRVPPVYPYSAKRRGVTGEVVARFLVDIRGRISRINILRAKPKGIFEESVRRAVAKWRFRPGVHQGRAVPTWVVVPITFRLSG